MGPRYHLYRQNPGREKSWSGFCHYRVFYKVSYTPPLQLKRRIYRNAETRSTHLMKMKPACLQGSVVIAALCLFAIPTLAQVTTASDTTLIQGSVTTSISVLKNIINILFFITVGTIGVLSYLQARKTLFTPIRTETFKLQLKVFEELLLYFEDLRRTSIDELFDLAKIFQLNTARLMDAYVVTFFKDEITLDEERRQERFKELVGGVISLEDMENMEDWQLLDGYIEEDEPEPKPEIKNPTVILAQWQKYRHAPIEYTAKFIQHEEHLEKFIASPLLPTKLKDLLDEFRKGIRDNLFIIGTILTEAAKELPEKYPSVNEIKKAQSHWLWQRYVDKRSLLEEEATKIQGFIRNYLKVESLLE